MLNEDFIIEFHELLRNTDRPQEILNFINSKELNESTKRYSDAILYLLQGDFISLKKSFDAIEITKEDQDSLFIRKRYNFLLFKIMYLFNSEENFFLKLGEYLKNPPDEIFYKLRNIAMDSKDPTKVLNLGYNFKLLAFDKPTDEFNKIRYLNAYHSLRRELGYTK